MFKAAYAFIVLIFLWQPLALQAQTPVKKVTIHNKKCTVVEALEEIKRQTGYGYANTEHLLENAGPISPSFNNADVQQVLDYCSKDQYFILTLKGDMIIVEPRFINVFGVVKTNFDEPVANATITISGKDITMTNNRGEFSLIKVFANATITVTAVNIEPRNISLKGEKIIRITVNLNVYALRDIDVIASNGYQSGHRRKLTSSSFVLNSQQLDQQSFNTIFEKMNGLTLGFLPTVNSIPGVNQPKHASITTRTTIMADPNFLLVVDGFPFYGDVNLINPDNIATINILKDAAATSLWGTKAGNGVIVVTTKSGQYKHPLQVSLNTSSMITEKPDLFYLKSISPADQIEAMKEFFQRNYYKRLENSNTPFSLPTVVEKLILHRDGLLSDSLLKASLDFYNYDVRKDLLKYFYRKAQERNVSLRLAFGNADHAFSIFGGYIDSKPAIQDSRVIKKNLSFDHTYHLKDKVELTTSFTYLSSEAKNLGDLPEVRERMTNTDGKPLSQPFMWRQSYIDANQNKGLLDWNYRPLEDFGLRNKVTTDENLRVRSSIKAQILEGLNVNIIYQYQRNQTEVRDIKSKHSYSVRNLVNSYMQRTATGVDTIIPWGNILDMVNSSIKVNNIRPQIIFNRSIGLRHAIQMQTGMERTTIRENVNPLLVYGYDENMPVTQHLDYKTPFQQYADSNSFQIIPNAASSYSRWTKFTSYYTIANYAYNSRVYFSASGRLDKTELFPDIATSKFIKLFSVGMGWNISSEPFFRSGWLSYLKVRTSIGSNGNAPITTIVTPINQRADRVLNINNQEVPRPEWERVNTTTIGFDMCTKNNIIEVSLDGYQKIGRNLIGLRPINSSQLDSLVADNLASIKGYGIDLVFFSRNINTKFRWITKVLASYVTDRVTKYLDTSVASWLYCEQAYPAVAIGKPFYSIYSYPSAGLDKEGDPTFSTKSGLSTDYKNILKIPGIGELRYHGRSTPFLYGSVINEFTWGPLSTSIIISYKFGYYFRRSSVNYSDLFNRVTTTSPDIGLRWKASGDEFITTVPSIPQAVDPHRDLFYKFSDRLVERGDHIRLQAINTSLDVPVKSLEQLRIRTCSLYLNVNNLGILWRANDKHIDPDALVSYPQPTSLYIGVKMTFR